MTSYLQFLQWLASLGPKLPQALAALQKLFDAITELTGIFATRGLKKAKAFKPTAKEAAAEKEVLKAFAAASRTRGIGDGKLLAVLQGVWAFLKANPELWALILKLIGA